MAVLTEVWQTLQKIVLRPRPGAGGTLQLTKNRIWVCAALKTPFSSPHGCLHNPHFFSSHIPTFAQKSQISINI